MLISNFIGDATTAELDTAMSTSHGKGRVPSFS